MEIAGGAMLGYCATGRVATARMPASMITIAITHAKDRPVDEKIDHACRSYELGVGVVAGAAVRCRGRPLGHRVLQFLRV
jgi:hypothetical protein